MEMEKETMIARIRQLELENERLREVNGKMEEEWRQRMISLEQKASLSEKKASLYEFILDNIPPVLCHSLDFKTWIYQNKPWSETYGYSTAECHALTNSGKLLDVMVPAGDQTVLQGKAMQLMRDGHITGNLAHITHGKTKETLPMYCSDVFLADYEGVGPVCLGVTEVDIESRHLQDTELIQNENYKLYTHLVNMMDVLFIRLSLLQEDGRKPCVRDVVFVSEHVERYGYKPSDFYSDPPNGPPVEVEDVFPAICDDFESIGILQAGQPYYHEGQIISSDGEIHHCAVCGQFMLDVSGTLCLEGVVRDTTAEHEAKLLREEQQTMLEQVVQKRTSELQDAVAEARSARDMLGQFVSTLSHELRTPCHSIVMMSSMLMDKSASDVNELEGDIAVIKTNSDILMMMLNQVLSYSRVESGSAYSILHNIAFDPRDCVHQVCQVLRGWQLGSHITIRENIMPDTPDSLYGDPSRVVQILMNFAGNAAKFTLRGSVSVSCGLLTAPEGVDAHAHAKASSEDSRSSDPSVWVDFSVADTGLGIAESDKDRVFEPFSRLEQAKARNCDGVGLGLAICKKLAEIMQGRIWFDSTGIPGEGTTFHLAVPFAKTTDPPLTRTFAVENVAKHISLTPHRAELLSPTPGSAALSFSSSHSSSKSASSTSFPLRPPSIVESASSDSDSLPVAAPNLKGLTRSTLRVLVVDDNKAARVVMDRALERLHVQHKIVDSGLAAVQCIEKVQRGEDQEYPLVFMDLRMPEMDGFEATRRIRQHAIAAGESSDQPPTGDYMPALQLEQRRPIVCALSASIEDSVKEAGSLAGCDYYLEKPLSFAGLKQFLSDVMKVNMKPRKAAAKNRN